MTSTLIFGGSGFLGGALCRWATSQGHATHATYLTAEPGTANRAEGRPPRWERCDILDESAVDELVARVRPDVVINAAYRQNGDDAERICAEGAHNVANAAARVSARFVHISTDLVFDGELGRPYREGDQPSPLGRYGTAKARAEQLVAEAAPAAAIVRTSLIYGNPEAPQERLVRQAIEHGDVRFFTDEWRNPVEVHALADAIGRLCELDHSGPIHLAGDRRLNRLEFATYVAKAQNLDAASLVGGPQDPNAERRAKDVSLDTTLAATLGLGIAGPALHPVS